MQDILVIDLNIIPMECGICELRWEESRSAPTFGVARYEDMIVPDDYIPANGEGCRSAKNVTAQSASCVRCNLRV